MFELAWFQDFFHHLLKRPERRMCSGFSESSFAKLFAASGDSRIIGGTINGGERCAHRGAKGVRRAE
jgi:hypothetical protein